MSNTEVWELMALVAWRLFYYSDIYIALYISKPVQLGSRFTTAIHVQALLLTYVYVINRHICKYLYMMSSFVYIYLRVFFLDFTTSKMIMILISINQNQDDNCRVTMPAESILL